MILYYSGYGCNISNPEVCLADRANIMLTFYDSLKKPHPRFKAVHKARKRKRHARNREGSSGLHQPS